MPFPFIRSLLIVISALTLTTAAVPKHESSSSIIIEKKYNHDDNLHHTTTGQRLLTNIEGDDPIDYRLAGYRPFSPDHVRNIALIDVDQAEIEQASLFFAFADAKGLYEKGGHAFSVATLRLDTPLPQEMPERSIVLGTSESGLEVRGYLLTDAPALSETVDVVYPIDDMVLFYCHIGGSLSPIRSGCFIDRGTVTIGGQVQLSYMYNAGTDTRNLRSIGQFSTDSQNIFILCSQCPLPTYQKFINYYGTFTYADVFVQAALDGTSTNFVKNDYGNIDFTNLSFEERSTAIPRFTLHLNIWMYVVGLLEFSLETCLDDEMDDQAPFYWDEAFAIYAGSMEGPNGSGAGGTLLYDLADQLCPFFGTCIDNDNTKSAVNQMLVEQFQNGLSTILIGQCALATVYKDRIVTLMTIPLLQGLLQSAALLEEEATGEDAEDVMKMNRMIGFTFATAVLPLVYDCDASKVEPIFQAFEIPHVVVENEEDKISFETIQSILESTYECLGITCEDIGDLEGVDLCFVSGSSKDGGEGECNEENDGEDCDDSRSSDAYAAVPVGLYFAFVYLLFWM